MCVKASSGQCAKSSLMNSERAKQGLSVGGKEVHAGNRVKQRPREQVLDYVMVL